MAVPYDHGHSLALIKIKLLLSSRFFHGDGTWMPQLNVLPGSNRIEMFYVLNFLLIWDCKVNILN